MYFASKGLVIPRALDRRPSVSLHRGGVSWAADSEAQEDHPVAARLRPDAAS